MFYHSSRSRLMQRMKVSVQCPMQCLEFRVVPDKKVLQVGFSELMFITCRLSDESFPIQDGRGSH